MDKALVLLSGGLDSATCLYWARQRYEVYAITFNYYGRLENERLAAIRLSEKAGVSKLITVDIPFIKEASDYYNGQLKKQDPDLLWSSYVPARNLVFYSIAAHYAEYLGAKWIIGGHNNHDVEFFKDASRDYFERLNSLFSEGCLFCDGQPYRIILPLAEMDRAAVIRLASEINVPIESTWSCHYEGDAHCGKCYACKQRLEAFGLLGIKDPVFESR